MVTIHVTEKRKLVAPIFSDEEEEEALNKTFMHSSTASKTRRIDDNKESQRNTSSSAENHTVSVNQSKQLSKAVSLLTDCYLIWKGILEWCEINDSEKITKEISLEIYGSNNPNKTKFVAEDWPSKLTMQLFAKSILGTVGTNYIKNSRCVLCTSTEKDKYDALVNLIDTNVLTGFVSIKSTDKKKDNMVFILVYSYTKKSFIGLIPHEQKTFIEKMYNAIAEKQKKVLVPKFVRCTNRIKTNKLDNNNQVQVTPQPIVDIQVERQQISQNIKELKKVFEETKKLTDVYKRQIEKKCDLTLVKLKEAIKILTAADSKLEEFCKKVN